MERRLAAILAADVVGYTRLMGANEAGTLRHLTELRQQVLEPLIAEHRGRVVKLMGDGLLVEFASVVDSIACAVAWQERVAEHEAKGDEDKRFKFRIGINLGDVIVEGDDIHGDGVNIAARLEGLAEPGGVSLAGPPSAHALYQRDDRAKFLLRQLAGEILGHHAFRKALGDLGVGIDDRAAQVGFVGDHLLTICEGALLPVKPLPRRARAAAAVQRVACSAAGPARELDTALDQVDIHRFLRRHTLDNREGGIVRGYAGKKHGDGQCHRMAAH